jgi:hypothetical protein
MTTIGKGGRAEQAKVGTFRAHPNRFFDFTALVTESSLPPSPGLLRSELSLPSSRYGVQGITAYQLLPGRPRHTSLRPNEECGISLELFSCRKWFQSRSKSSFLYEWIKLLSYVCFPCSTSPARGSGPNEFSRINVDTARAVSSTCLSFVQSADGTRVSEGGPTIIAVFPENS